MDPLPVGGPQTPGTMPLAGAAVPCDPHSPPLYRVNGVVRNIDAWYEAFGVMPGDALYVAPENRVRIW